MTVADDIARWVHEKGIQTAFTISGGGNFQILNAIARLGKTEIVAVHHEQSAVLAAGFYYRRSGRMAVALVTTGAGSTNAITGVMSAWMDSTPVLVISGNESMPFLRGKTRVLGTQGYDSRAMVAWHCNYATRYEGKLALRDHLNNAYNAAVTPRMGPCWVDVPKDLQNAVV